jgi:hypothetical protein
VVAKGWDDIGCTALAVPLSLAPLGTSAEVRRLWNLGRSVAQGRSASPRLRGRPAW